MYKKGFIIGFFISLMAYNISAQNTICVEEILIQGNRTTKEAIVLAEIVLHEGECYISKENIRKKRQESESNLLNTQLFTGVNIHERYIDSTTVQLVVDVKEAIQWLAAPRIQFDDESFATWWTEHRAIERINWGLYGRINNLTGRRDELSVNYFRGMTKLFSMRYASPYYFSNKWRYQIRYQDQKQNTIEFDQEAHRNRELVSKNGKPHKQRTDISLMLEYRPSLRKYHRLRVQETNISIDEDAWMENPNIIGGTEEVSFFTFTYGYVYDKRDNRFYPQNGYSLELRAEASGVSDHNLPNSFVISPQISLYHTHGSKIIIEHQAQLRYNLNKEQNPFYFQYNAGQQEGMFFRGYETYHFKTDRYGLLKNTVHFRVLDEVLDWKKKVPLTAYRKMPVRAYLTMGLDAGYMHNQELTSSNELYNESLIGGSIGVNLLLYDQFTLTVEYSKNQLGRQGMFFHFRQGL